MVMDADKLGNVPARDARLKEIAGGARLRIIWEHPCHEAFLLRHLQGCKDQRPQTSALAMSALRHHWPEYTKGMPATRLADRIGDAEVRQAQAVEPELAAFLADIGFV
jgi:hypothetical protein